MMPAVELLVSIATALAFLYGGLGVLRGTILVGVLVAFILYIQRFFDPIRTLTMEYGQLQRAMASGARVFELMDVSPEVPEAAKTIRPSQLKGDITFENVSFRYEVGGEVLHSINLKI
jgi:ATP-binding cassette subfamily B protein